MPRQKPTYNQLICRMERLWSEVTREKERMTKIIADALLENQAVAAKLGCYSDADLKRIVSLLAVYIDDCISVLESEKRAKKKEAAEPPAEQERIPLSALHEGAKDPAPSTASSDPARTLSLPVRDSGYPT